MQRRDVSGSMTRSGRSVQSGIGLIDTLVALTLLAFSLLGASATLIRTLGANRAAALQTTAVDLAADLSEDQRGGPELFDAAGLIRDWNDRVAAELPIGTPPLAQGLDESDVTLRWWDPSIHGPTEFALQRAGTWPDATP